MLRDLTARELAEWEIYYELEPFGAERGDMQAGIVGAALVELLAKRGTKVPRPSDFILYFDREDVQEMRNARMRARWQGFVAKVNAAQKVQDDGRSG